MLWLGAEYIIRLQSVSIAAVIVERLRLSELDVDLITTDPNPDMYRPTEQRDVSVPKRGIGRAGSLSLSSGGVPRFFGITGSEGVRRSRFPRVIALCPCLGG